MYVCECVCTYMCMYVCECVCMLCYVLCVHVCLKNILVTNTSGPCVGGRGGGGTLFNLHHLDLIRLISNSPQEVSGRITISSSHPLSCFKILRCGLLYACLCKQDIKDF